MSLETSNDAFEFVIRWLYIGVAVLSPSIQGKDIITQLIAFAKIAHFLCIEDCSTVSIEQIKATIIASPNSLVAYHIRDAFELPSEHPVPTLIVEACILPYIKSLEVAACHKPFRFQKEVVEVGDFGNRLFQCYDKVVRARTKNGPYLFMVKDPLTKTLFNYQN